MYDLTCSLHFNRAGKKEEAVFHPSRFARIINTVCADNAGELDTGAVIRHLTADHPKDTVPSTYDTVTLTLTHPYIQEVLYERELESVDWVKVGEIITQTYGVVLHLSNGEHILIEPPYRAEQATEEFLGRSTEYVLSSLGKRRISHFTTTYQNHARSVVDAIGIGAGLRALHSTRIDMSKTLAKPTATKDETALR